MAATINARAMAARVNAALAKAGSAKRVDAKRVRAWVRDNVAAYDDDGYTAHAYDARTAQVIERGMVAARVASKATSEREHRATSASEGRPKRTPKPADALTRSTERTRRNYKPETVVGLTPEATEATPDATE